MSDILSYGLVSVLVMLLVQWVKQWASMKKVDPLILLGGISILGGIVYALLNGFGFWDVFVHYALTIAAFANTIYQVLDRAMKALGDGTSSLSREPSDVGV